MIHLRVFAAIALLAGPASAAQVRICRPPYSGYKVAIHVPAGMRFVDTGAAKGDDSGTTRPVAFVIRTAAVLAPRQACAIAAADVQVTGAYKVGPHDGRRYGASMTLPGNSSQDVLAASELRLFPLAAGP
jgi:hypothetical protein